MAKSKGREGWKLIVGLAAVAGIVIVSVTALILTTGITFGDRIAVIEITGTISSTPSFLAEVTTPDDVFAMIDKAEEDPGIRGVLFKINSPGGSVVASREIAQAVKGMEKPTLCWMGEMGASGAYWVASSCDHVMSDPLTLTGSIGVTASYLEFSKLFEKYGVTYEQITSGENKDMGSPFRNLTESEREKMEYLTDEIFDYFLNEVIGSRGLSEGQVAEITGGDIFLGKDAVELGLVDSLGTIQDAEEKIKSMAGYENAKTVTLKKKGIGLLDLLGML